MQNIPTVALTRANAKALNLINPHSSTLDGTIVMSGEIEWHKVLRTTAPSAKFDLTSVAMHEIGHILGFVGGLDAAYPSDGNSNTSILTETATSLDLFRYYGTTRDLRLGSNSFSLDGGITKVVKLSYGAHSSSQTNAYQASHWKNTSNIGLMDPVAELGKRVDISDIDLRAFDAIGWDRVSGTKSDRTLYYEGKAIGLAKNGINRNTEVGNMLKDWLWARRGSATGLTQEGNIAQFLAQEGFFSIGAFRSSFDFSSVNSTEDNNSLIIIDNRQPQEFQTSDDNDSDLTGSSDVISDIDLQEIVENQGLDYEQMLALVTEDLSDYELSQLSLDDLRQLIEQQLVETLTSPLD